MTEATATRPSGDPIPVLLYHSVSDAPHAAIADYTTGVDEFSAHVAAIAASGRKAVSFGELVRRLKAGDLTALRNLVCVTFDDGWADNLAAARVLASATIPATFFVTSSFVGHPGMLSADELRELAALPGMEIGAHSVTHPHLDELSDDELAHELRDSRTHLSELLGGDVATFAYPHGAHGPRVLRATIEAGYESAAAVKNAISHPGDDVYAVARWTVLALHDADDLRAVLSGTRGVPAWSGEKLRTVGFRSYRRMRRRIRQIGRDGGGNGAYASTYGNPGDGQRIGDDENSFFSDGSSGEGGFSGSFFSGDFGGGDGGGGGGDGGGGG